MNKNCVFAVAVLVATVHSNWAFCEDNVSSVQMVTLGATAGAMVEHRYDESGGEIHRTKGWATGLNMSGSQVRIEKDKTVVEVQGDIFLGAGKSKDEIFVVSKADVAFDIGGKLPKFNDSCSFLPSVGIKFGASLNSAMAENHQGGKAYGRTGLGIICDAKDKYVLIVEPTAQVGTDDSRGNSVALGLREKLIIADRLAFSIEANKYLDNLGINSVDSPGYDAKVGIQFKAKNLVFGAETSVSDTQFKQASPDDGATSGTYQQTNFTVGGAF